MGPETEADLEEDQSFFWNHRFIELILLIFLNISCDGNTWYCGADRIETTRDVKAGEQLTYDYALTETTFSHFDVCDFPYLFVTSQIEGTLYVRRRVMQG